MKQCRHHQFVWIILLNKKTSVFQVWTGSGFPQSYPGKLVCFVNLSIHAKIPTYQSNIPLLQLKTCNVFHDNLATGDGSDALLNRTCDWTEIKGILKWNAACFLFLLSFSIEADHPWQLLDLISEANLKALHTQGPLKTSLQLGQNSIIQIVYIHPSAISTYPLEGGCSQSQLTLGEEAGCTLDSSPENHRADLESPINLHGQWEEAPADTRRTCKLHTESFRPRTCTRLPQCKL